MLLALFPGQGSQHPGMGVGLLRFDSGKAVFDAASEATGVDVAKLCAESDEATIRATQNAQLALFTCGVAAFRITEELGSLAFAAFAGHSVGEYAALTAAGALDVTAGAKLVRKRGELMAASGQDRPGTMAAIVGLDIETLERVCEEISEQGQVVVANDNCPGQVVISGDVTAVECACALASERGAKRTIPLNVSGAFHSPLMAPAAEELAAAIGETEFKTPSKPVYSNVEATPGHDWKNLLSRQLTERVRWRESMERALADGATGLVEFGAGEVLGGLMKRIDRKLPRFSVVDGDSRDRTAAEVSA